MDPKTRSALAALPNRLSALLIGNVDAVIDAAMAEAEADTGLFNGLSGTELAEHRYLYRIGMLADEMRAIVADTDGSEDVHKRRGACIARLLEQSTAEMA